MTNKITAGYAVSLTVKDDNWDGLKASAEKVQAVLEGVRLATAKKAKR